MINIFLILLIIIADQLTKWWIVENFMLYETQDVISGFFNLTYITNTGAAFGFLSGDYAVWRQIFFATVSIVALAFMIYIYKQLKEQGRIFVIAICMIGAGAVGNLIDRLRLGAVVDFLDFHIKGHHWPAFNVADSAITVGVGLFIIGHFFCACKCDHKKK